MRKDLLEKLNEFLANTKAINTWWYQRFFELLDECGVSEVRIEKALDWAISDENVSASLESWVTPFFRRNKEGTASVDSFFEYLAQVRAREGEKAFRAFLEAALDQMYVDQQTYLKEGHSVRTNLSNLFVRNVVLAHPEDVQLESKKTPMSELSYDSDDGLIEATIGGAQIGHIKFQLGVESEPNIEFTEFRTLAGLERLGIGKMVFGEFCRQINRDRPCSSVCAWNVMKGRDGSKTYSKWGAYPVVTSSDDGEWKIERAITPEELDQMSEKSSTIYYFAPEVIAHFNDKQPTRLKTKHNESE